MSRPYDGIPTAEQEALQPPDWDPIDAAVAGMTVGGNLPARAAAAGMDVFAQGLANQLPWYVSLPASMAAGHLAGKAMPRNLVPGGAPLQEVAHGLEDGGLLPRNLVPGGAPLQEAGAIGPGAGKYIDTWHVSPHKFDRFDSAKIGTGEGSQYRGYGMYFAESPEVSGLTPGNGVPSAYDRIFQQQALTAKAQDYPSRPLGGQITLAESIIPVLRHGTEEEKLAMRSSYPELTAFWEANKPSIYQTRLHVDPDQLLDLDAPVSQALLNKFSPSVQEGLTRVTTNKHEKKPSIMDAPESYTGWDLYSTLMRGIMTPYLPQTSKPSLKERLTEHIQRIVYGPLDGNSPPAAAAYLNSVGIPGNKFLDQNSRMPSRHGGRPATRNYVMYPGNDDKIEILKRWGMLLPLAEAQRQEDPER